MAARAGSHETGERLGKRILLGIVVLPGTVAVAIPASILALSRRLGHRPRPARPGEARFWIALVLASAGMSLALVTVRLFATVGKGTPAPWDPPPRFVVAGPYRFVRNPMITGVLLVLAAEATYFRSAGIAAWLATFFAGNNVYFPRVEEVGLERRFGADYAAYKAAVPRWIPRPTPLSPLRPDR